MIKGITPNGFELEIDEEALDDMEMLEGFTAISKGDVSALPGTLEKFLGKEQKDRLYDFCRSKTGRVSAKKVMEETNAIFVEIGKSENSVKN